MKSGSVHGKRGLPAVKAHVHRIFSALERYFTVGHSGSYTPSSCYLRLTPAEKLDPLRRRIHARRAIGACGPFVGRRRHASEPKTGTDAFILSFYMESTGRRIMFACAENYLVLRSASMRELSERPDGARQSFAPSTWLCVCDWTNAEY